MKKILFINPATGMSGAEISLLGLMTALDRKQYQPLLLLPGPGPFQEQAAASGIETAVLPALLRFDERYRPGNAPRVGSAILAVRRIVRGRGIDLVHSNKLGVSYIGGLAARLAHVRSLLHVRDSGLPGVIAPWKGRLLDALHDRFIAVSQAARSSLIGVYAPLEKKTAMVYNGIDLAAMDRVKAAATREELGLPPCEPLIGALGRIEAGKGCDVLIRAAGKMTAALPGLRVLIVGPVFAPADRGYMEGLKRQVREQGLEGRVLFPGQRADALEIIKALDVIVHPALCPDSLPRTVLEAAALGRPVVASRVGGIPEIIEHGISGMLVEPGNADALAETVVALLRHPQRASLLAAAARKVVEERFTIARHVAAVTAVYKELWRP